MKIAMVLAALLLAGCVRTAGPAASTVEGSNAKLGLWAVTPEGCKIYVLAGGGNTDRLIICPGNVHPAVTQ